MPCDHCQGNGCLHCEKEEERQYNFLSLGEFQKMVMKCPNSARIRINGNDIWVDWNEIDQRRGYGNKEVKVSIIIQSALVVKEKPKKKRYKKLTKKDLYKIATTWPKKMRL